MTTTPITGQTFGQEDARDPTHTFLQAESQKPFAELLPDVLSAREKLLAVLDGVSDVQARFVPPGAAEGEEGWPIAMILQHVTGAEDRLTLRLRILGGGEDIQLTPPAPQTDNGSSVAQMVDALNTSRTEMLAAMNRIAGGEYLDVTGRHPMFGDLNCRAFFRLQGLHEEDHARQIAGIKAHPDYPKA